MIAYAARVVVDLVVFAGAAVGLAFVIVEGVARWWHR